MDCADQWPPGSSCGIRAGGLATREGRCSAWSKGRAVDEVAGERSWPSRQASKSPFIVDSIHGEGRRSLSLVSRRSGCGCVQIACLPSTTTTAAPIRGRRLPRVANVDAAVATSPVRKQSTDPFHPRSLPRPRSSYRQSSYSGRLPKDEFRQAFCHNRRSISQRATIACVGIESAAEMLALILLGWPVHLRDNDEIDRRTSTVVRPRWARWRQCRRNGERRP